MASKALGAIPLVGILATGCAEAPKEDIEALTCDELRTRITYITKNRFRSVSMEHRMNKETWDKAALKRLRSAQIAKNCE